MPHKRSIESLGHPGGDYDRGVLQVTHAYVADCFRAETTPRVAELAARLQLSRSRTTRAIRRQTGRTASAYLKHLQVVRACALLRRGVPLARIVHAAGFGTRATFFRVFRATKGISPAAYRRGCTK